MFRVAALAFTLAALAACTTLPLGGNVAGDIYEIRLAIQELQARQESLSAEIRAARAAQGRDSATLGARLDRIERDLRRLSDTTDRLRLAIEQSQAPPPIVRHELIVPRDPEARDPEVRDPETMPSQRINQSTNQPINQSTDQR